MYALVITAVSGCSMALSKMARAASKILPIRKQVLHGEDDSLQKNVAIRALLIFASNNYTIHAV